MSEEEVAQLQARCNDLWHELEPTQQTRDEADLSATGEYTEDNQTGFAATGCGGLDTDDST